MPSRQPVSGQRETAQQNMIITQKKYNMELKTLHLEEEVVFPKNLNEMIFDKNIIAIFDTKEFITPEKTALQEQGFWGTRGADNRLHVYFNRGGVAPFIVRVIPNYEDDNDKVLTYQLTFYFNRIDFRPLYKYINEWGRKNLKGEISLTKYFAEWVDEQISDYNSELEITTTTFNDEIMFETKSEVVFVKMLAEVSAAFRKLATEHSNKSKDSYDNYGYAAILNYKEKHFDGVDYGDLVENILISVLTVGLNQGLEEFRINRDEDEQNHVISIAVNQKRKSILFYDGAQCKGKAFFEFKLGAIIPKSVSLIDKNNLSYSEEVANWFKEAIQNVQNIYKKIGPTIKIPEAGNPVLECFE